MSTPLRVLILEDQMSDVELMLHELRQAGFDPDWQRVETEADYLAHLGADFDVILADYNMPQFDAPRALRLLQERGLDIPFIIVTGSISEEVAVESMKQGAADYLLKDRLARLGPAVAHALEQRKLRVEKRRADQALRDSEKRFRALIDHSSDAIALISTDGAILYESSSASRIVGYAVEELVGEKMFGWIHPDDLQNAMGLFAQLLSQPGASVEVEFRYRHKDGSWRWLEGTATNLLVEPSVQAVVANYRDGTERKRAEAELAQKAADLEAHNAELDAFAHTVSHQVKQPLTRVVTYAEWLQAENVGSPEESRALQAMCQSAYEANNIIDELLLLASVRQDEVRLDRLDMAGVVSEALRRLEDQIEQSRAQVIQPKSWPVALGHGPWIAEVWVNHISNALKYGGHPPHVELGGAAQPDGTLRFWVKDNGPGIPPKDQARLFTPFVRLRHVHGQGHGLGLSIVRRIVEKCGGQVGVESQAGAGSTFWFTLPGVPEAAPLPAA